MLIFCIMSSYYICFNINKRVCLLEIYEVWRGESEILLKTEFYIIKEWFILHLMHNTLLITKMEDTLVKNDWMEMIPHYKMPESTIITGCSSFTILHLIHENRWNKWVSTIALCSSGKRNDIKIPFAGIVW